MTDVLKTEKNIRYELSGVDCPTCAIGIEQALHGKDGLETAVVDFAGGAIRFNPVYEETVISVLKDVEPNARIKASSAAEVLPDADTSTINRIFSFIPLRLLSSLVLFALGLTALSLELGTPWPEWILFAASYALAGYPVVFGAVRNILKGRIIDELFLMTVATIGAFAIGELPEAAAVMLFYAVGEALQDRAVSRSRDAIRGTMALRVSTARLVSDNEVREVSPESVGIGSIIEILPGDSVPLDGMVTEGESWVDTSALTGESVPRRVSPGDTLSAGFINEDGRIRLQTTKEYGDSAIAKVKKLLDEASSRKSKTEMVLSRFAAIYTPVVVGLAALLIFILPLFFDWTFSDSIYSAMILLVISCPCALVVSVPLAYFAGIGRASRDKTLLRGSDILDGLSRVKTFVFDKTGTLTEGNFRLQSIVPAGDWDSESLLETAAEVLSLSNHPIARSVRDAWGGITESDAVDSFKEIKGKGVMAEAGGRRILAGSSTLLLQEGISSPNPEEPGSIVHLAVGGKYAGYLLLSDSIKQDSAEAISELKAMGTRHLVMLTGDRKDRGEQVARSLGIDEVKSELLPEGKMAALEDIITRSPEDEGVAFIGDGLNDAPVILRADIGMAMGGSGTDLAIESADVVFMDDNPIRIPRLMNLARFTRRIVIGNIVFALVIKLGFMVLGVFAGLPMWVAVIGDVGVSILAVLNSLRILYGYKSNIVIKKTI